MKRNICIILSLILCISLGRTCTESSFDTDQLEAIVLADELSLSEDDFNLDRYVDFNQAFTAPSSSCIGIPRNHSGISAPTRIPGFGKRPANNGRSKTITKGKIDGPEKTDCFIYGINLFPSGKTSSDHHFISLRKLVI